MTGKVAGRVLVAERQFPGVEQAEQFDVGVLRAAGRRSPERPHGQSLDDGLL